MRTYLRGMKILGAASLLALGLFSGSVLAAGIANSKHDLSNNASNTAGSASGAGANGTTEICVFCHTPHGSAASTNGPLWNRTASAASYTNYANAESMDSAGLTPSSSSLACLSCHDGTVAMDSLVNKPGSGTGAPTYTWAGAAFTTKLLSSAAALIGSDLRNDHPIGVAYCGGFVTAGGACVDGDFFTANLFRNGTASMVNTGTAADKWWIETGANTTRNKTDLILYARSFVQTGAGAGTFVQPSVECASCHNVHDNANGTFLRMANTGSALCLTCHNK